MSRRTWTDPAMSLAVMLGTSLGMLAQQPAQAPAPAAVRPPLLFREEWKQPPYTGELDDQKRRILHMADAVGNPNLELTLYGPAARDLLVAEHEGRHDLWTGLVLSPIAATLRDKNNYVDPVDRSCEIAVDHPDAEPARDSSVGQAAGRNAAGRQPGHHDGRRFPGKRGELW